MFRPRNTDGGWLAALILAAAWALIPALPALWRGEIPGSPWTDLYPSVWGLGWFAHAQPGLPTFTHALGAPAGMPFYYSSPLHGWLGTVPYLVGGPAFAYDVTLIGARFATVMVSFGAFRASGLGAAGALAGAAVYGASPFFHGYAVEGIVEGTDGWTLPLWAWMVWSRHRYAAAGALALVVISSWYLGMVACVLAFGWGFRRRDAWFSLAGLLPAAPFVLAFLDAMHGATPLPDAIRAAMGSPLGFHRPGLTDGVNPFALNAWIGLSTILLALVCIRAHPALALGAVTCAVLSLGVGPWYDLPVLESVRFPYRWHAGTLFCLGALVGHGVERIGRSWLAVVPAVEALILSPVEPILPGASADVPALYDAVVGPVLLEVPGPVAMPPGEINPSRPRARYLLYFQLHHGAASPWSPDFNGVAGESDAAWLSTWSSWDPLTRTTPQAPDVAAAKAAGVTQVMVHRAELRANADPFEHALVAAGATRLADEGDLVLYALP